MESKKNYIIIIINFMLALSLSLFYSYEVGAQALPTGLSVDNTHTGTNILTWNNDGPARSDTRYKVYCSTVGAINDTTKTNSSTFVLTDVLYKTNYATGTVTFRHALADYYHSDYTNSTSFFYAVTSMTGGGAAPGGYWEISVNNNLHNDGSDWAMLHYEATGWQDDNVDAYGGGNNTLEMYVKLISGNADNWEIQPIAAATGWGNSVTVKNYGSLPLGVWEHISIPVADLFGSGNEQYLTNVVAFRIVNFHTTGNTFTLGVDEVKFTGGTEFLWYGNSHEYNDSQYFQANQDGWCAATGKSSGGAGGTPLGEKPLSSGVNATAGSYANHVIVQPTKPGYLTVTKYSTGTNKLVWSEAGYEGKCVIYCSTSGPITEANKSSAVVLTSNVSANGTGTYLHDLTKGGFNLTADKDYTWYYAVAAKKGFADGSYIHATVNNNAQAGPDYLRVCHTFDSDDIDVTDYGDNTHLSIRYKIISGNASAANVKVEDSSYAYYGVSLSTYITADGSNNDWQEAFIPMSDFSGMDFTHTKSVQPFQLDSTGNTFEMYIDEIKFVGGRSEYLWWGDGSDKFSIGNHPPSGPWGNIFSQGFTNQPFDGMTIERVSSGGYINTNDIVTYQIITGINSISEPVMNHISSAQASAAGISGGEEEEEPFPPAEPVKAYPTIADPSDDNPVTFNFVSGKGVPKKYRLVILDLLGRKIIEKEYEKGTPIQWNGKADTGTSVQSAVYIYYIEEIENNWSIHRSPIKKIMIIRK